MSTPIKKIPLTHIEEIPTGDYIPLTGTEEGKPVTGPIEVNIEEPGYIGYLGKGEESDIIGFGIKSVSTYEFSSIGTTKNNLEMAYQNHVGDGISFSVCKDGILLYDRIFEKGLVAESYYGVNYTDNTYVQKKYVDQANSYSTTETKTGGTWDGLPIYRKIVSIRISPDFPILEDYINLETFFPGIVNVVHSSFVTDREDFGGAISYTNSVDGLFNWEISKIFGEPMKLTGRKYDGTFMDLNDMYGVTITLEYTKTI